MVFRILLFKLFNSIGAWQALKAKFGIPTWKGFNEQSYAAELGNAWANGVDIWNNAYMQNDQKNFAHVSSEKHPRYIRLLKIMMDDGVTAKLEAARTYRDAFQVLYAYPLHKGFIGMQHLTDINYSEVINFDEDDFIIPGPGAYRGLQKCFGRKPSEREASDWIRELVNDQEVFFEFYGLKPVTLNGRRRIHAIDAQNLFCETDKVARLKHPEFKLKANERIKQTLNPTGPLPPPFFPPKWGI